MRKRLTKAELCEQGLSGKCEISPAIGAALIGAGGNLLGSLFGGGKDEKYRTEQQSSMPQWSPHQMPYLFQGTPWQPEQQLLNPFAVNYASGLSAGYNPTYGPQPLQSYGSLLGSLMGYGGGSQGGPGQGTTPWFQDPSATPQPGGIAALLGMGMGPPPALMQSPQFGFGVQNPELLHQQPGSNLTPGPQQAPPPQPQGPGGPAFAPTPSRGYQDLFYAGSSPRFGPWWDQSRGQGTREYVEASRRRGEVLDRERKMRGLQGRNINDLTEEERALLGL